MGKTSRNILFAIIAIGCWICGFWVSDRYFKPDVVDSEVIIYDTIERNNVQYETKYITKTVVKELPIYDTVYKDSVRTIFVEIPIYTYHFEEDSLYSLDVEGYEVSLKRIQVFPKTVYQTRTVYANKKNRFGLGVQAGYGIVGHKGAPYLGIGVSYNLITW